MGSLQSTMSGFKYHRLSHPPSSNSLTKPLLNYQDKLIDQELEIEANQEKSAALDRALADIRSSVSRLQSKVSIIESRPPYTAKQDAELHELNLRVAKLESRPQVTATQDAEMQGLKLRVAKLESAAPLSMKKQEEEIEKLEKRNVELKRKLAELTTAIHLFTTVEPNLKLKKKEAEIRDGGDAEKERIANPYNDESWTNDLVGCLVVIIFLVSILVGLHM